MRVTPKPWPVYQRQNWSRSSISRPTLKKQTLSRQAVVREARTRLGEFQTLPETLEECSDARQGKSASSLRLRVLFRNLPCYAGNVPIPVNRKANSLVVRRRVEVVNTSVQKLGESGSLFSLADKL
jgi:hypothetical protein